MRLAIIMAMLYLAGRPLLALRMVANPKFHRSLVNKIPSVHRSTSGLTGRHFAAYSRLSLTRLFSTADVGKKNAREKAKNEVRDRNMRYREASSSAKGGEKNEVKVSNITHTQYILTDLIPSPPHP